MEQDLETTAAGVTAIEVTLSSDEKYAFVSEEDRSTLTDRRGTIEVFELHKPTTKRICYWHIYRLPSSG